MIFIFAYTPYQMINSLNLVKSMGEECVVGLRFFWDNSLVLANNFDDSICDDFVKGVYYLKDSCFKSPSFIKRIVYKCLYGEKSTIRHYFPEMSLKYKFDGVVLSKQETCGGVLKPLYSKDVKYYFVEDGLADYIYDDALDGGNAANGIDGSTPCENISRYISAPEIFTKKSKFEIKALPKLNIETMPKSLPEFFRWNENENNFNKFIYFTQMFEALPIQTECPRIEKELYDILEDAVEEENITVKLHPRSEANAYGKNGIVSLTPWELISALSDDIEDKVLISMCSGSVFFTKLLCDKEPYVICLMKIYAPYIYHKDGSDDEEQKRTFDFINGVKNSYKNKNKFFIPETIDEYRQILNDIKQGKI